MVVAINTAEESDPVTKARSFQQRHGLTYPILVDANGAIRKAYAVSGFPTNMVIDRQGTVRYVGAGFDAPALDHALQELMTRASSPAAGE